jgi:hypothetical protein
MEYYHLWEVMDISKDQSPSLWVLRTESGWLGQKKKIGCVLELAQVDHPDPVKVLEPVICEALKESALNCSNPERTFPLCFMHALAKLADDNPDTIAVPEPARTKMKNYHGEFPQ